MDRVSPSKSMFKGLDSRISRIARNISFAEAKMQVWRGGFMGVHDFACATRPDADEQDALFEMHRALLPVASN